ncbi:PPOX class F420-dependent oxidoreductase [Streptomyces polygonati]|uniref:PPOX class F420-dependent oxidoreductase n=1 Tax=Streptomyces polygonati TaxID=1617087 RepID=A0ABV8HJ03_9ACTN
MAALSDSARALIDANSYATVGTIQPDGQPQLSLVWVTRDGDDVLFSTLASRRKHTNLVRDPRITVLITLPETPYSYLEIRGTATLDTEGGDELINTLSLKYTGKPYDSDLPGAVRVVVRVSANHIVEHG